MKPGGASKTVSRWLIQQVCSAGGPASSRPGSLHGQTRAAELAHLGALDAAAELEHHRLHAVTDAEHRDAELEQLAAQLRRAARRTRTPARRRGSARAAGARVTSSSGTSCGSSSANTPHSRTRRAISCEYWPPKSRTRTSSVAARRGGVGRLGGERLGAHSTSAGIAPPRCRSTPVRRMRRGRGGPHADLLVALELLALGLERRRDHHLGLVEGGDVLVAAGGHRGAQAAHQVEGAVVLVRRAEQDLLERAVLRGLHARAARQRRDGRWPCPSGSRGRAPRRRGRAASRSSRRRRRRRTPSRRRRRCACRRRRSPSRTRPSRACAASARPRRRRSRWPAERRCRARRAWCRPRPGRRRRARRPRRCASGAARWRRRRSRRRRTGTGTSRMNSFRLSGSGARRHVLGRDHRALDDEDVEAGLERGLVVVAHALRRERGRPRPRPGP